MTTLAEAQGHLAQSTEQHAAALKASAVAKSALATARTGRAALLDAIADGASEKSVDDLASADELIRDLNYQVELQDLLVQRAKSAKDDAEGKLRVAANNDVKSRIRGAIDEQIAAGKALDAAMAAAQAAAEYFNGAAAKIGIVTHEAHGIGARVAAQPSSPPVLVKFSYGNGHFGDPRGPGSAEQIAKATLAHFGTSLNVS